MPSGFTAYDGVLKRVADRWKRLTPPQQGRRPSPPTGAGTDPRTQTPFLNKIALTSPAGMNANATPLGTANIATPTSGSPMGARFAPQGGAAQRAAPMGGSPVGRRYGMGAAPTGMTPGGARPTMSIMPQQTFSRSLGAPAPTGGTFSIFGAAVNSISNMYDETLNSIAEAVGGGESFSGGDASKARGIDGALQYKDMAQRASQETGVPWEVIVAIMGLESGGNPGSVSVAGATGLMQVMPNYWQDTANKYGGNLRDPWTNIRTGAEILKLNHDKYGSWQSAAAAYLGAVDAQGNPTTAADAYGTTGHAYVDIFNNNLAALGFGGGGISGVSGGGNYGAAIDTALKFVGQGYVWGGESPQEGFDCSGLVQWSFKQMGKNLPRTAQEQYNATNRISREQLQAGDLVFYTGTYDAGVPVSHVGIYMGNGQIVQSGGKGVAVISLDDPYYGAHLYGYGRV